MTLRCFTRSTQKLLRLEPLQWCLWLHKIWLRKKISVMNNRKYSRSNSRRFWLNRPMTPRLYKSMIWVMTRYLWWTRPKLEVKYPLRFSTAQINNQKLKELTNLALAGQTHCRLIKLKIWYHSKSKKRKVLKTITFRLARNVAIVSYLNKKE